MPNYFDLHTSADKAGSWSVTSPNDPSTNNLIPRELAIKLLQELISKASFRLHVAMRKQAQPTQAEPGQVDRAPKLPTPQQMQRLLDRLGSEAYRELEHRLGFKPEVVGHTLLSSPSGSPRTPVLVPGGMPLDEAGHTSSKARLPAQQVDGSPLSNSVRATCHSVRTCSNTHAADALSVSLCAARKDAIHVGAINSVVSPEVFSSHSVHPDQHTEYLGSSQRAGSPSRPACFDVYQGYRQRGTSQRTQLNLQEQESGVTVCWVPGGRHQGTFNKFGALQAAAGISRKTCTGTTTKTVKFRSACARQSCGDDRTSPAPAGCAQPPPAFPPAAHALLSTAKLSACFQGVNCSTKSPNLRTPQSAHFECSDKLDSPKARLSFDLRASRLMDPVDKSRTKSSQRSYCGPKIWRKQPDFPPTSAAAPHQRRKWPESEALSLTIDDQQQGTGHLGASSTAVTDTVHTVGCAGKSFNAASANLDLQAQIPAVENTSQATCTQIIEGEVDSSRMGQFCGCREDVIYRSFCASENVKQMEAPDIRRQAGSDSFLLPCDLEPVANVIQQEVSSGFPSTMFLGLARPNMCKDDIHTRPCDFNMSKCPEPSPGGTAKCSRHAAAVAAEVDSNTKDKSESPASVVSNSVADACVHAQRDEPPSASGIQTDHVSAAGTAEQPCTCSPNNVQHYLVETNICTWDADCQDSPRELLCFPDDSNLRMRQHLDKAYQLVDHLSHSAELMQRLHSTSSSPEMQCAARMAAYVAHDSEHQLSFAPDTHSSVSPKGKARGTGTTSAYADFARLSTHYQESHINAYDHGVVHTAHSCDSQHAQIFGYSSPQAPVRLVCSSWNLGVDPKPDIGRSRSLTSSSARMPFGTRPSDAIVNRVDEIQRSVERLRQAQLGAKGDSAISTLSGRIDSMASM